MSSLDVEISFDFLKKEIKTFETVTIASNLENHNRNFFPFPALSLHEPDTLSDLSPGAKTLVLFVLFVNVVNWEKTRWFCKD
jgi:hypothetical protein